MCSLFSNENYFTWIPETLFVPSLLIGYNETVKQLTNILYKLGSLSHHFCLFKTIFTQYLSSVHIPHGAM